VAELGCGAWLGAEPLRVCRGQNLLQAIVATGIPHAHSRQPHEPYIQMLRPAMRVAAGIRRMGAAALDLAYVAAGRFSVFFEQGLYSWDIAAGPSWSRSRRDDHGRERRNDLSAVRPRAGHERVTPRADADDVRGRPPGTRPSSTRAAVTTATTRHTSARVS